MKYLLFTCLFLASCGSSSSGDSESGSTDKSGESAPSPTTAPTPVPLKWEQYQINAEVSSCTVSAMDTNSSLPYSVAFARCTCLFDYFARKYTYEDMAANVTPYFKEAQDNGTVAECIQRFPQ